MPFVKGHETTSRRDDDVPCTTADASALYKKERKKCGQLRLTMRPGAPSSVHGPPAPQKENTNSAIRRFRAEIPSVQEASDPSKLSTYLLGAPAAS